MSKQKRISQTADLEQMIDRLRKRQNTRLNQADECDAQATEIFQKYGEVVLGIDLTLPKEVQREKKSNHRQIVKAQKMRVKASRLRAIKGSSTEKRIRHLSLKLAELRTGVLPGITTDESVNV